MIHDVRTVAIVGAGMAGLACAKRLRAAGLSVRLFDKGRSVGGRVATRRVETALGQAQFDHGAQFFSARHPNFLATLQSLPEEASLLWRGAGIGNDWRAAAPGISALPKSLAAGLEVSLLTRVEAIVRQLEQWVLVSEAGAIIDSFDAVILATPAEQAAPLLAPFAPWLAREAAQAVMAPCWAGLFAFHETLKAEKAAYELENHPVLNWIACDSTKPGRSDEPQCWVAHARPDWTRAHLEAPPEAVAPQLLIALASVLGPVSEPLLMQAHRWRYAKVEQAAASSFGWDPRLRLGACGDWRLGPRIELAWRSGHELAGAMLV